jgi:hypothetical protein
MATPDFHGTLAALVEAIQLPPAARRGRGRPGDLQAKLRQIAGQLRNADGAPVSPHTVSDWLYHGVQPRGFDRQHYLAQMQALMPGGDPL